MKGCNRSLVQVDLNCGTWGPWQAEKKIIKKERLENKEPPAHFQELEVPPMAVDSW
jgi:hypothetical protein